MPHPNWPRVSYGDPTACGWCQGYGQLAYSVGIGACPPCAGTGLAGRPYLEKLEAELARLTELLEAKP